METYLLTVTMQVEVQAYGIGDAFEAVEDCFGQGEACGLKVTEFEVTDHESV